MQLKKLYNAEQKSFRNKFCTFRGSQEKGIKTRNYLGNRVKSCFTQFILAQTVKLSNNKYNLLILS